MRIFLILIILTFSTLTFSQVRLNKPEILIGTSHGISGSMIAFNPSVSQSYLLGYNGGISFRYIGEKNVGLHTELNYSQRGWKEASGLYARQLNYIEIPFMTHIYIGNANRVFFNLGPKISYLISEKTVLNQTNDTETQHITPIQNSLDYGLCAGLGFMFTIKRNIYQIETRANYSLSDVFSNDKRDYFDTSNNLNLSINLSWLFAIN